MHPVHRIAADFRARRPPGPSKKPDAPFMKLSPRQKRFVSECLKADHTLGSLMEQQAIRSRELARWLVHPDFCAFLEHQRQELIQQLPLRPRPRDAAAALKRLARDIEFRRRTGPLRRPLDDVLYPLNDFMEETQRLLNYLRPIE